MGCGQVFLCCIFPPLAVVDKGCGTFAIILLLTLCGWIPGVIGALIVTSRQDQVVVVVQNSDGTTLALSQLPKPQEKQGNPLRFLVYLFIISVFVASAFMRDEITRKESNKGNINPSSSSHSHQKQPIQAEKPSPVLYNKPGFVILLKDSREVFYEKIEKSENLVTVELDGGGKIIYPMDDIREIREVK